MVALPGPRYHPRMVPAKPILVPATAALLIALFLIPAPWGAGLFAAPDGVPPDRPVTIRVTWGGGKPRAWSGSIRLVTADGDLRPAEHFDWQTLCADADAAATAHATGDTIVVHEPSRRNADGVELTIFRWRGAKIAVRLIADGNEQAAAVVEAEVADLVLDPRQQPLDRDGNRLMLKAAPGDGLRVAFSSRAAAPGGEIASALFRPGEIVRLFVDPLLPKRSPGAGMVELRMRLKAAAEPDPLAVQSVVLAEAAGPAAAVGEPRLQPYDRVFFDVPLPAREAAYDIEFEAVERGGLRWSRPLATRTVQVAAVADVAADAGIGAGDEAWKVVYELDPGSPRLHERLRRLPGVGMSYVPMPALPMPSMSLPRVSMPTMPLPSVPMPSMPMPSMPNMPMPKLPAVPLPAVSLPSVSSMVPKLSGLLATGHSTVEAHVLGPMLRLPPARSATEPAWEGIVVAGVQPGVPHLVEVEFPNDQRAVVGATVLEADAAAATVEVRWSGGFETAVAAEAAATPKLRRHAFIFWPTTRNPLILLSNPSSQRPAVFGRVRVSAGPARLPPRPLGAGGSLTAAIGPGRRVHAFLPTPDFSMFGAVERAAAGSGRSFTDWKTFLSGGTHAAEWFRWQGAQGAMVVAYRDGAAIWPSRLTRGAPRWDSGATADAGLDPVRKDLLGLLCRIHDREGLLLVPAVSFDAPLPVLEAVLAGSGPEAVGIACIGRDGRPAQTAGGRGCHYNVLDPRVQQAVEDVVRELAGRLRGARCVDGVAVVLPHDGWMHLPGTAWCLDDATFARFLADVGGQEPATGAERFARRAALVEGPLKEQWLEWRAGIVASFHSRLAQLLAEHDERLSLHVVPTTLFAKGDIAARFRPALEPQPADADVLREIGLDPGRITADPRIVFVSPHVHAAADSLLERGLVDNANRSLALARGAAAAARRGMIAVEDPLAMPVDQIVPHGPFGGAAAAVDTAPIHAVADGASRSRPLAESLVASDVEVVYDMGLSFGRIEPDFERLLRAFAVLPAGGFELAEPLPAPLVVRSRRHEELTVVSVANAGPAACRAGLMLGGAPLSVLDAVQGNRLPLEPAGGVAVPLEPWEVRTIVLDGGVAVQGARVAFDDGIRRSIETRLADLGRRRRVLETPRPLDVLDNPGFELVGPGGAAAESTGRTPSGEAAGGVGGWELVEASRGTVAFVPGVDGSAGRGICFSSVNGLSTLRSNPFPPSPTGRVSVAVWLRIPQGDPQPPLRLALEGVQDGREYYRFAPVGGLAGGKPLTAAWSQFVLQVDDLPTRALESLRVRFDLLGPGSVQIDGVRVFDLAFDESQRVQLSRRLALMEERLSADDLGSCLVELDTYWPKFLATFVSDEAVAALGREPARGVQPPVPPPATPVERSGSMFDRVRRWWQ